MSADLRCPTCRSPWRGAPTCPRCRTDLADLIHVAVRAWKLREAARLTLCAGDRAADALALARAAYRLHATPRGRRLLALASLAAGERDAARPLLEEAADRAPDAPDALLEA